MATMLVRCPNAGCGASYRVAESLRGKSGRCTNCKRTFTLEPPATEADSWQPGDVLLGLYQVKGVLGEGGMGKVYRVHHPGWNLDLAVKSPRPQLLARPGAAANFEREAETWVKLGLHPHVASCFYVRRLGGIPRVFAEYVAGGSLHHQLRSGTLHRGRPAEVLARLLDVAIQFCWGLRHAHDAGLVHRDVKPANVLMTPDGTAKVTDFGLARAGPVSAGALTPAYCSPEQAAREKLTLRTDIWSWAVSILELFAGEVTWRAGPAAGEALEAYVAGGSEHRGIPLPTDLVELLRRCLRTDPRDRPADMGDVAERLKELYRRVVHHDYPRPEPQAVAPADSLNNRAVSLLDLGNHADAVASWDEALRIDPNHAESVYNLGLLRWRAAKVTDDGLLRDLDRVESAAPGGWLPGLLKSHVHLERGDCRAARAALAAAAVPAEARDEADRLGRLTARGLPQSRGCRRVFGLGVTHKAEWAGLVGKRHALLLGGSRRELKLVELETGRAVRSCEGHTDRIWGVALRADRRVALTGGQDGTARLWRLADGCCLRTLAGHAAPVTNVGLSDDGRRGLSVTLDGAVTLWDLAEGRPLWGVDVEGLRPTLWPLAFLSGDGRRVFLNTADRLELWDAASGKRLLRREWGGHVFDVRRDGRTFVSSRTKNSAEMVGDLEIREVADWRLLTTLPGSGQRVGRVALSPDGRRAVSSEENVLHVWDLSTGARVHTLGGEGGRCGSDQGPQVRHLDVSADGRYALALQWDHTLRVWDLDAGRCVLRLEGHKYGVREVCLSDDSRQLLSRGSDGRLILWDTATGKPLEPVPARPPEFRAAALTPDGRVTVPGTKVAAVGSSADGRHLVSAGFDGAVRLWDAATGRCLCTLGSHQGTARAVQLTADGSLAVTGGDDGTVRLWSLRAVAHAHAAPFRLCRAVSSEAAISSRERHERALGQAREALTHGDAVAAAEHLRAARSEPAFRRAPEAVRLWAELYSRLPRTAFRGAWPVLTLGAGDRALGQTCFSRDGKQILAIEADTLSVWDVITGRPLAVLGAHEKRPKGVRPLECADLSEDGRLALAGNGDNPLRHGGYRSGRLRLWQVATGEQVAEFPGYVDDLRLEGDGGEDRPADHPHEVGHRGEVTSCCLFGGGRYAASVSSDTTLKLWDVAGGRHLRTIKGICRSLGATVVCVTPDERAALTGGWDNLLKLWDLSTGCLVRTFSGHSNCVRCACVSRDGRHLLSGSADGTARLWDLASGECLRVLGGHPGSLSSADLSADGRFALTAGHGGAALLWDLTAGECVHRFENRSGRAALSPDGRCALLGDTLWLLDWELEGLAPADWDEGPRPYLNAFLVRQSLAAAALPSGRTPTEDEVHRALSPRDRPRWTEEDFGRFLDLLGWAGYGWLRPEGIRRQLEKMTAAWQAPPAF